MMVKTCLLISDDPDDHVEFSEALDEISDNTVVMTVSNLRKAIDLLVQKKCRPDFVLLDLAVQDDSSDDLFDALAKDPLLENVRVIAYGDTVNARTIDRSRIERFMDASLTYSELKSELQRILGASR